MHFMPFDNQQSFLQNGKYWLFSWYITTFSQANDCWHIFLPYFFVNQQLNAKDKYTLKDNTRKEMNFHVSFLICVPTTFLSECFILFIAKESLSSAWKKDVTTRRYWNDCFLQTGIVMWIIEQITHRRHFSQCVFSEKLVNLVINEVVSIFIPLKWK